MIGDQLNCMKGRLASTSERGFAVLLAFVLVTGLRSALEVSCIKPFGVPVMEHVELVKPRSQHACCADHLEATRGPSPRSADFLHPLVSKCTTPSAFGISTTSASRCSWRRGPFRPPAAILDLLTARNSA